MVKALFSVQCVLAQGVLVEPSVHSLLNHFVLSSTGKEASFIHAPCLDAKLLGKQFDALREAGATGVMLDVW